jgi:hypothetical protein
MLCRIDGTKRTERGDGKIEPHDHTHFDLPPLGVIRITSDAHSKAVIFSANSLAHLLQTRNDTVVNSTRITISWSLRWQELQDPSCWRDRMEH